MIFFTSDLHLGHGNIIGYCNRPFKNAYHMNKTLINNWNMRVGENDTVFHVGDFCCKGRERGVEGTRTKAESWEEMLNGKIVHIRGNHDRNNTVKVALESAVLRSKTLTFLLHHRPYDARPTGPSEVIVCGHVHEKWSTQWFGWNLAINVGVDARQYMPMTLAELITAYWQEVNRLGEPGGSPNRSSKDGTGKGNPVPEST